MHEVFAARPEQESETAPLNPFCDPSERVTVPGWLALTLNVLADDVKVKSPPPVAGATAMEPKRPSFSPLMPAAKYSVLGSPTPLLPKTISHKPELAIGFPEASCTWPTKAYVFGS